MNLCMKLLHPSNRFQPSKGTLATPYLRRLRCCAVHAVRCACRFCCGRATLPALLPWVKGSHDSEAPGWGGLYWADACWERAG